MTTSEQTSLTNTQITAWLRGLLTIAWSDDDFSTEEQRLIASLTRCELIPHVETASLQHPITPTELATELGVGSKLSEDFLRTAVMVAVADGFYSPVEDGLIHQFCDALGHSSEPLQGLRLTLEHPEEGPVNVTQPIASTSPLSPDHPNHPQFTPLKPLQEWLDHMEIHDPRVARFLCKMIPPQCPFERDIQLFGHKVVHIPPLCKLNPLYEQLVGLRFRSLCYLADECGEDVAPYC
ncbi:MAG: Mo-dependent nitrogenase C-terminal domain-containing protein [Leptolyngbyaceae cyanobacterium bins.59]|nr:Mo-dependent nitrogenase C-terminal domain-containing protein [Leptolyngbyaceae cyanobacterium bins.59]